MYASSDLRPAPVRREGVCRGLKADNFMRIQRDLGNETTITPSLRDLETLLMPVGHGTILSGIAGRRARYLYPLHFASDFALRKSDFHRTLSRRISKKEE